MALRRIPLLAWMLFVVVVAAVAGVASGASSPPAPVNPVGMVNLDKNTAYNNALLCLQNTTALCPNLNVNGTGVLHVNATLKQTYCDNCANQTLKMLNCTTTVYPEFRFSNTATPMDVAKAINEGCHGSGNFTVLPSKSKSGAAMIAPHWAAYVVGSTVVAMAILVPM